MRMRYPERNPGTRPGVPVVEHRGDATPFLPERRSLKSLREAAAGCRGCHLYEGATQTVFGEGLKRAKLMLVGEMPGDREDREGHPFVGPAGRELDKALERFVTATIHPSAILRARDDEARHAEREAFTGDLQVVADYLEGRR